MEFFLKKRNKTKEIILVDDEADVLFTYKIFLKEMYDVTSFFRTISCTELY